MPFTIFVHVLPKSCVRKMYGALSSSRGRFTATYAVAESNADASMRLTRPKSGMSFGVTFVHVLPPSFVTLMMPSSEPVQMTFVVRFDGAIAKMHRVHFRAVHVARDRTARRSHRLRIVAREIGADAVPALAAVRRLPQVLRSGVEHLRVDRREDDRIRPLPAFLDDRRLLAREHARIRAHFARLRRCGD